MSKKRNLKHDKKHKKRHIIRNLFLVIFIFCEIIRPIRGCSIGYDELWIVLSNAILSDFDIVWLRFFSIWIMGLNSGER